MHRRDFLRLSALSAAALGSARVRGQSRRARPTAHRRDRRAHHREDGGVPRSRRGGRPARERPADAARIWRHQRRRSAADHADTLFTIASISKTMTATAVMKLVEEGRVELRAPIRTYLPDFRVQDEAASRDGDALAPADAHARLGGAAVAPKIAAPKRSRTSRSTIMRDLPQLAQPRRGVELQQRRLRAHGPRHRSRHRTDHSRRAARSRLRAARADALVHARHRRDDLPAVARPPRPRTAAQSDSPVSDDVQHDRRRGR